MTLISISSSILATDLLEARVIKPASSSPNSIAKTFGIFNCETNIKIEKSNLKKKFNGRFLYIYLPLSFIMTKILKKIITLYDFFLYSTQ